MEMIVRTGVRESKDFEGPGWREQNDGPAEAIGWIVSADGATRMSRGERQLSAETSPRIIKWAGNRDLLNTPRRTL